MNQLLLGHHYQQQAQLNGRLLNQLGMSGSINPTGDLLALQRSLNAQAYLTQQQQQQQHQHLNLSNLNGQFNQNNLAQSILNSQNNLLQAALQQQQQGQPILYRTQNGSLINQLQLNSINGANGSVVAAALAHQNANANPHRYLRPQLNANNLQFGMSPMSSSSSASLAASLSSSSPSISSPGNANTNSTNSPANSSNSNMISLGSSQQQSQQRSLNNNLSGLSAAYS